MIREALADAGLSIGDVDGLAVAVGGTGFSPALDLAEELGIHPTWTDTTNTGGSSYEIHVEHAAAAVAAGLCEVAVSVYAATARSSRKQGGTGFRRGPWARRASGRRWPNGNDGQVSGCRSAPMPSPPAVTWPSSGRPASSSPRSPCRTRQWAERNPRARLPDPIDDRRRPRVTASSADPLHMLDCCLVTDGAGAVRGHECRAGPGPSQAAGARPRRGDLPHPRHDQRDARSHGHGGRGRRVRRPSRMAGIKPADVDSVSSTTASPSPCSSRLEDLGFCRQGRGRSVRRRRQARPGRRIADEHERRRAQLHASRHVRDVPPRRGRSPSRAATTPVSVAHGCGGVLSATGTVVLGIGGVAVSEVREEKEYLPPIGEASGPFWEATKDQRLVIQWCVECDKPIH